MFSGVIFDLDGLVLDSESSFFVAWKQAAQTLGFQLDDEFCVSMSGLHGSEVYRRLQQHCGPGLDLNLFASLSRRCWQEHIQQQPIRIKPGFQGLLTLIEQKSLPFALATNSARTDAESCLLSSGLKEVFPVIVTRNDVEHGKPDPEIFVAAAERLGLPVVQCLVLEDSPIGVVAAKAAGAHCIYVPSQNPPDAMSVSIADQVMVDLNQVADFVSVTMTPWL